MPKLTTVQREYLRMLAEGPLTDQPERDFQRSLNSLMKHGYVFRRRGSKYGKSSWWLTERGEDAAFSLRT